MTTKKSVLETVLLDDLEKSNLGHSSGPNQGNVQQSCFSHQTEHARPFFFFFAYGDTFTAVTYSNLVRTLYVRLGFQYNVFYMMKPSCSSKIWLSKFSSVPVVHTIIIPDSKSDDVTQRASDPPPSPSLFGLWAHASTD